MKIATWNINGARARVETLVGWLRESEPDVLCLQEIKSTADTFPREALDGLGYNIEIHGQKGFNGVAILSKRPLEDVTTGLAGDDDDEQARFIEATVSIGAGSLRVASIYLPNGNPVGTSKFSYKLAWMERLCVHVTNRLSFEEPLVLAGDYNVIPQPFDARHPERWHDDALFQPESRLQFQALLNVGLTDAVRACHGDRGLYTFWDYQRGAWQRNDGIRIDHLLLSPHAADRLSRADIDQSVRAWDKPSDHVPAWIELNL